MADDRYPVALNAAPGEAVNTLVLAGLDLVFPLEADLDGDPDTEDVVRLWSEDGMYDRSLTKRNSDVQPEGDAPILAYTFRDVPPGIYRLSAVVRDRQFDILRDIVVTRTDALHGGTSLAGNYDPLLVGTPDAEPVDDPYDPDHEIEESYYGLRSD
jgi:hypothetical protein